jgi:hypothetical protein
MYGPVDRRSALEALATGSTLSDVSRATGVARSTLREWTLNCGEYKNPDAATCPLQRPIDHYAYERRYTYPRYFFSNRSEDILQLCEWALDLLGSEHRRSNKFSVSVARRASVAALDEHVGAKS